MKVSVREGKGISIPASSSARLTVATTWSREARMSTGLEPVHRATSRSTEDDPHACARTCTSSRTASTWTTASWITLQEASTSSPQATPTMIVTRRSSRSVRTITGSRKSAWLGITTSCPSVWRMRVSRIMMVSTRPSSPSHSTKPPIRNGSRSRIRIPARKFSNASSKAKPTATDPRPSVVSARPGVIEGNTTTSAIRPPANQIAVLVTICGTSTRSARNRARRPIRATTLLRGRTATQVSGIRAGAKPARGAASTIPVHQPPTCAESVGAISSPSPIRSLSGHPRRGTARPPRG